MAELGLVKKMPYLSEALESGGWDQSFVKRKPETIWFPWKLTARKFTEKTGNVGEVPRRLLKSCILTSRALS